jgi:hypothetical protein
MNQPLLRNWQSSAGLDILPRVFMKCKLSEQSATETFLSHLNPVYTLIHYFNANFNIILPSTSKYST